MWKSYKIRSCDNFEDAFTNANMILTFAYWLYRSFMQVILGKFTNNTRLSIQPAITCSKLTIETLEQGVKYVQS